MDGPPMRPDKDGRLGGGAKPDTEDDYYGKTPDKAGLSIIAQLLPTDCSTT